MELKKENAKKDDAKEDDAKKDEQAEGSTPEKLLAHKQEVLEEIDTNGSRSLRHPHLSFERNHNSRHPIETRSSSKANFTMHRNRSILLRGRNPTIGRGLPGTHESWMAEVGVFCSATRLNPETLELA